MSDGSGATPEGKTYPCAGCGASLAFDVVTQRLACAHCGSSEDLAAGPVPTKKDLQRALWEQAKKKTKTSSSSVAQELPCRGCGALVVFDGTLTSSTCSYCDTPLQLKDAHKSKDAFHVDAVCTFVVDKNLAKRNLADWTRRRWFAPNDFVDNAVVANGSEGGVDGVYLPFFLFDAFTVTRFDGERGDAYFVTKPTITTEKPQKERKIRWTKKSGRFERAFRDLCVPAFRSLSSSLLRGLEPWPTHRLRPFTDAALHGWRAHRGEVGVDDCFDVAEDRIHAELRAEVKRRIGGDEQRVSSQETRMGGLRFQSVLFPLWVYARRYRGKAYVVVVNAVTGQVHGERPYSVPKIAALVAVFAIALVLWLYFRQPS